MKSEALAKNIAGSTKVLSLVQTRAEMMQGRARQEQAQAIGPGHGHNVMYPVLNGLFTCLIWTSVV